VGDGQQKKSKCERGPLTQRGSGGTRHEVETGCIVAEWGSVKASTGLDSTTCTKSGLVAST